MTRDADEIAKLEDVVNCWRQICIEARAKIERLKAENAELRAMIDEGLPTADDVRGIMQESIGAQATTMNYRYTPGEIGELNVVIDDLRAEVERLTTQRNDAQNLLCHMAAEIAQLRAELEHTLETKP